MKSDRSKDNDNDINNLEINPTKLDPAMAEILHSFLSLHENQKNAPKKKLFVAGSPHPFKFKFNGQTYNSITFSHNLARRTKGDKENKEYIYSVYSNNNLIDKGGFGSVYSIDLELMHRKNKMVKKTSNTNKKKIIKVQTYQINEDDLLDNIVKDLKSKKAADKNEYELADLANLDIKKPAVLKNEYNLPSGSTTVQKYEGISFSKFLYLSTLSDEIKNIILENWSVKGTIRLLNLLEKIDPNNADNIFKAAKKLTEDEKGLLEKKLTNQEKISISMDLILKLNRIHKKGILHRDIKPANILIDPITLNITFIDYGLAIKFDTKSTAQGTKEWLSPEMAKAALDMYKEEEEARKQKRAVLPIEVKNNPLSDVYSLMLILRQLWGDKVWEERLKFLAAQVPKHAATDISTTPLPASQLPSENTISNDVEPILNSGTAHNSKERWNLQKLFNGFFNLDENTNFPTKTRAKFKAIYDEINSYDELKQTNLIVIDPTDPANLKENAKLLHEFLADDENKDKNAKQKAFYTFYEKDPSIEEGEYSPFEYKFKKNGIDYTFRFTHNLVRRTQKKENATFWEKLIGQDKEYIYSAYSYQSLGSGGFAYVHDVPIELKHSGDKMKATKKEDLVIKIEHISKRMKKKKEEYKQAKKKDIDKSQLFELYDMAKYGVKEEFNLGRIADSQNPDNFRYKPNFTRVEGKKGTVDKSFSVMKKIQGTNLLNYLMDEHHKGLNFNEKKLLSINLIIALRKLHETGIIHRDIKADNIIIDPLTFKVTIIDFGLAVNTEYSTGIVGSPIMMAPETAHLYFNLIDSVDHRIDIYGLGLILREIWEDEVWIPKKESYVKNPKYREDNNPNQIDHDKILQDKKENRLGNSNLKIEGGKMIQPILDSMTEFYPDNRTSLKIYENAFSSSGLESGLEPEPFYKAHPLLTGIIAGSVLTVVAAAVVGILVATGGIAAAPIAAAAATVGGVFGLTSTLGTVVGAITIGIGVAISTVTAIGVGIAGAIVTIDGLFRAFSGEMKNDAPELKARKIPAIEKPQVPKKIISSNSEPSQEKDNLPTPNQEINTASQSSGKTPTPSKSGYFSKILVSESSYEAPKQNPNRPTSLNKPKG